jgi:hypothetical protein
MPLAGDSLREDICRRRRFYFQLIDSEGVKGPWRPTALWRSRHRSNDFSESTRVATLALTFASILFVTAKKPLYAASGWAI